MKIRKIKPGVSGGRQCQTSTAKTNTLSPCRASQRSKLTVDCVSCPRVPSGPVKTNHWTLQPRRLVHCYFKHRSFLPSEMRELSVWSPVLAAHMKLPLGNQTSGLTTRGEFLSHQSGLGRSKSSDLLPRTLRPRPPSPHPHALNPLPRPCPRWQTSAPPRHWCPLG